jgi:putative FmdB family regulatory protein
VPTYQYACTECGHDFEAVQSFSDAALTECPRCSGRLRKVFNSVGIVFKGSGFYRTDSRDTAKASANGSNGSSESAGDKPAAKSDTAGGSTTKTDTPSKPASGAAASSGSSTKGSAA